MNKETKESLLRALRYVQWAHDPSEGTWGLLASLIREIEDPHECEDWANPPDECDYCNMPMPTKGAQ